jgi:hypothetical protein
MGLVYRTDWDDVADTDPRAEALGFEEVSGIHAIWVKSGTYREASVADRWFEVDEPKYIGKIHGGVPTVEVKCLWFGRKHDKKWMRLTICGDPKNPHDFKEDQSYSGPVVRDFYRRIPQVRRARSPAASRDKTES